MRPQCSSSGAGAGQGIGSFNLQCVLQILVDTLDAVMEPHHSLVRRPASMPPFQRDFQKACFHNNLFVVEGRMGGGMRNMN